MFSENYKKQEARLVRWGFFILANIGFVLGLYKAYYSFPLEWEWAYKTWNLDIPALDFTLSISPKLAICVGSALLLLLISFYLCWKNHGFSEFLINIQNKWFRSYKATQGHIVRWGMFFASGFLFMFGTYRLYFSFSWFGWERMAEPWATFTIPLINVVIKVSPSLVVAICTGIFFLLLFAYLCFRNERISDFLIDTESEMRKVSWPTVTDVIKSSMAVIFIIILLGFYLFVVDIGLDAFFGRLFKL